MSVAPWTPGTRPVLYRQGEGEEAQRIPAEEAHDTLVSLQLTEMSRSALLGGIPVVGPDGKGYFVEWEYLT